MPPTRQTNPWTFEQRLCLDVLWTPPFTNLSLKDRAKAHNAIFNNDLTTFGASHGRTTAAISAQYVERTYTHKSSWKTSWGRVCAVPKLDPELREEFRRKINDVLQLGEGSPVGEERADTPPETPRRTERVRKLTQNPYDSYADGDPITPVQQQQVHSQAHATSNPYATPGPSTRKRPAAAASSFMVEEDDDELLYENSEHVPKAKRPRRVSPQVCLSPPPENIVAQVPRTPTNKSPKRREGANMLFTQPSGRELMLKPKEHEQASRPLQDVTEEAAHPHPPGLLFRYWHSKSHGMNSSEGFVSGKFVPKNILVEPRGPPDCATIDMNDFAHHLNNRTGTDQDGVPSPL